MKHILVPKYYNFPNRVYKVYLLGVEQIPSIFVHQEWGIEVFPLKDIDKLGVGYYAFTKPYNGGKNDSRYARVVNKRNTIGFRFRAFVQRFKRQEK